MHLNLRESSLIADHGKLNIVKSHLKINTLKLRENSLFERRIV